MRTHSNQFFECLKNYFSELIFICCMQMTYNLVLNVKSHEKQISIRFGVGICNLE
jgi:hypothetical protein